jgi:hypothetical protein
VDKQALSMRLDIFQKLRRCHLLELRDQLADAPPVEGAGQWREKVTGNCEREELGQRDGRGFEFRRPLAGLDRPGLAGRAAIGAFLGLRDGVAELLQKLDVAADVLVGHFVDHAAVAEPALELSDRERIAGAEQDVDQVKDT